MSGERTARAKLVLGLEAALVRHRLNHAVGFCETVAARSAPSAAGV